MVVKHSVEGYGNFIEFFDKFTSTKPTFVLYTGSKLSNGDSWCPDCVEGTDIHLKNIIVIISRISLTLFFS